MKTISIDLLVYLIILLKSDDNNEKIRVLIILSYILFCLQKIPNYCDMFLVYDMYLVILLIILMIYIKMLMKFFNHVIIVYFASIFKRKRVIKLIFFVVYTF